MINGWKSHQKKRSVPLRRTADAVPREELFITTKLWVQDTGYEKTKIAFERSVKELQLEYLDLYLIHQAMGDYYGSWRVMKELYKEGRVRAIGVSNFFPDRVVDLIAHNEIIPAVNQIEINPLYQRADEHELLKKHNILTQSRTSFAEGKMISLIMSYLPPLGGNIINPLHRLLCAGFFCRGLLSFQSQCVKNGWSKISASGF